MKMLTLFATFAAAAAMAAPSASGVMTLTSRAISPGAAIPKPGYYTRCQGANRSPDLRWSAPPRAARSLVLTMIDTDAERPRLWSHWIVVDLPVASRGLPANAATLPVPAKAVKSNFGDEAYDGPCPPQGSGVHHYQFTIWAMPTAHTTIQPDATAATVLEQLKRTALASGALVGTAER